MNNSTKWILILLILFMGDYAFADNTFRCGQGQIVSVGNTIAEVYAKCGEPTFRDRRLESSSWGSGRWGHGGITTIEDWTYNLGANEFMYRLIFAGGRLVKIESLDYGFNVYNESR